MSKRVRTLLISALLIFGFSLNAYSATTPQYGGKLTVITTGGPAVIGYYPDMGPTDVGGVFPGLEVLVNMGEDRGLKPQLAESFEVDQKNLTMTFNLRKGVKFHDGSELNSEVAVWMFNLLIDTNKIQYGDQISRVEAAGKYKVILHLKSYNNQMLQTYGWTPMFSKVAFDKHGKEWCKKNLVGTGPFKLVKWRRGSEMRWKKNTDYWKDGRPYLDAITFRYIPDPITASALMQAGAGDVWNSPAAKEQSELQAQGLVRKAEWPGMPAIIYFNTKKQDIPLADVRVRKAIEYAINKAAITKATGYGFSKPIYQFHPEGEWANDPNLVPRTYNPDKARELLKEAGYSRGLKLDLMVMGAAGGSTEGEAIKSFLGDVGVKVHLDLADVGRYYGSMFGLGWKHMLLGMTGIDQNSLATIQSWFGHAPRTNIASFERPETLIQLSKKSITLMEESEQIAVSREISRYIADNALMLPMSFAPTGAIIQPYVHTNYLKTGFVNWEMGEIWMEKH